MEIVKPLNQNYTYVGDASMGIADLPCRVSEDADLGRTITSAWKPTAEELLMLINGGTVELSVLGHGMPPVMLSVAPVNGDLFVREPLPAVIGYCQQWADIAGDYPTSFTFDQAEDDAKNRVEPNGWAKVGAPFPVSRTPGHSA